MQTDILRANGPPGQHMPAEHTISSIPNLRTYSNTPMSSLGLRPAVASSSSTMSFGANQRSMGPPKQQLTLVVGNKNFSSWSLRPWLLLKMMAVPFEEMLIPLTKADSQSRVLRFSPSGQVPVLLHGDIVVWDSLAICEYLAELLPDCQLWPQDRKARAVARSVCAEMHSSFMALRRTMPMNCTARFPWNPSSLSKEVRDDIDRIQNIWKDCLSKYGQSGAFLFGKFSIVDAFYAPVCLRFITYNVPLTREAGQYVNLMINLRPIKEWVEAAQAEEYNTFEYPIFVNP